MHKEVYEVRLTTKSHLYIRYVRVMLCTARACKGNAMHRPELNTYVFELERDKLFEEILNGTGRM
jgi:hypothetical protein